MKNFLPDLSKSEWVVMKKIWKLKKTSVREVYEELKDSQDWAYNTVRTIMDRLRAKGYLEARRVGNMHFYEPTVSQGKIIRQSLHDFAERVMNGTVGSIFANLIKDDKLSDAEIKQIKNLIQEKEK